VRALDRCGDPAELARAWGSSPLLVPAGDAGERRFADLLSLDLVDALVTAGGLRRPAVRLVSDGENLGDETFLRDRQVGGRDVALLDPAALPARLAGGATLILQGLQFNVPAIMGFCSSLEEDLGHPVQANAYLSPPVGRAFRLHHDVHDVLALQITGRKRWQVFAPIVEAPLAGALPAGSVPAGPPLLEAVLEPGDVLYVPRGFPHEARPAGPGFSLHLTVGVRCRTAHDVLRELVSLAIEDSAFRGALPLRFGQDGVNDVAAVTAVAARLRSWLADPPADAVVAALGSRFHDERLRDLRGALLSHVGTTDVGGETAVAVTTAAVTVVEPVEAGGDFGLEVGGRQIRLPLELRPAVDRLLKAEVSSAAELHDLLAPEAGVGLIRLLVREGVLVTVRRGHCGCPSPVEPRQA
jgi:Cupin superfamily protein